MCTNSTVRTSCKSSECTCKKIKTFRNVFPVSFTSRSTAQDQEEIEKKDMAIPNVWATLKKRIIPHRCENADQLVQALHLEWDSLAPDTVSPPYVESMPRRVEALIEADGGHTKY